MAAAAAAGPAVDFSLFATVKRVIGSITRITNEGTFINPNATFQAVPIGGGTHKSPSGLYSGSRSPLGFTSSGTRSPTGSSISTYSSTTFSPGTGSGIAGSRSGFIRLPQFSTLVEPIPLPRENVVRIAAAPPYSGGVGPGEFKGGESGEYLTEPIDITRITEAKASKNRQVYSGKELARFAKMIGLKTSGKKPVLVRELLEPYNVQKLLALPVRSA